MVEEEETPDDEAAEVVDVNEDTLSDDAASGTIGMDKTAPAFGKTNERLTSSTTNVIVGISAKVVVEKTTLEITMWLEKIKTSFPCFKGTPSKRNTTEVGSRTRPIGSEMIIRDCPPTIWFAMVQVVSGEMLTACIQTIT